MLCQELCDAFENEAASTGKPRLILTAAVAAGESTVETAYDVEKISAALDLIHIMSYDLHGSWDGTVGHHSQFFHHPDDPMGAAASTSYAAQLWLNKGLPANKLVFGLPAYGRGFSGVANPGNVILKRGTNRLLV